MKRFNTILIIVCATLIVSCDNDDIIVEPSINQIISNPFFPLDFNDTWIYQKDNYSIDDTPGGNFDDTTITTFDTIQVIEEEMIENFVTRKIHDLNFHTTENKITVFVDYSNVGLSILKFDFLFTDKKDTTWTYEIDIYDFAPSQFHFHQSVPKDQFGNEISDELRLHFIVAPSPGNALSRYEYYHFKKGEGLIWAYLRDVFYEIDYTLIEFIDN